MPSASRVQDSGGGGERGGPPGASSPSPGTAREVTAPEAGGGPRGRDSPAGRRRRRGAREAGSGRREAAPTGRTAQAQAQAQERCRPEAEGTSRAPRPATRRRRGERGSGGGGSTAPPDSHREPGRGQRGGVLTHWSAPRACADARSLRRVTAARASRLYASKRPSCSLQVARLDCMEAVNGLLGNVKCYSFGLAQERERRKEMQK